jgi:glycosyltransferase involved in cell wall biosynthesis
MRLIGLEENLGLERGSVAVCIPLTASDERTLASVRGVLMHSRPQTPVLLAGSSATIERISKLLDGEHGEVMLLGMGLQAAGETEAVNAVMRVSFPADMALVAPGVVVSAGWLERLQAAAGSDSTVATATPLSIGGGGVELFVEDPSADADLLEHLTTREEPGESLQRALEEVEEAAGRILAQSLRLWPRVATIGAGCAYIRRVAWELQGPLPGSAELGQALSALARSLVARGMVHVVADDVLVSSLPGAHGPPALSPHLDRDPVQETIVGDERGPLRRSLNRGRTALRKLSVTIDGRALTGLVGGTQTYILELILALARERETRVRVLVAPDVSHRAIDALATTSEVELLSYDEAIREPRLTDVVHRPQQVFTPDDLALLRLLGERIVIGQQDLISYHNNTYHPDIDAWRAYRRATRLAMAVADQVVFFSEHARRDALAEDLLVQQRTHVIGIGMEAFEPPGPVGDPPDGLRAEDRFLLCLGADYAHKNRLFAIELLGALKDRGWSGKLVLAGTHVPYGSSRDRETELLANNVGLAEAVVDLGPVEEMGRQWLYAHACALLYPTLYEGFGLIPIEASRAGLPCLFAAQASLPEIAPGAATLVPWDAGASAAAIQPLLNPGPAREAHMARLRGVSVPGWGQVGHDLLAVYEQALSAPSSPAAPRAWQELEREAYIVRLDQDIAHLKAIAQEYQDLYHALEDRVSGGLSLIDKEGGLLSLEQQRALMRIASRGRLGSAMLAPLDLLGRGHRVDPDICN